MAGRGEVFEADALEPPRRRAAGLIDGSAALVISNPPFFDPRRAQLSPDAGRRRAHVAPDVEGGRALRGLARGVDRRVPRARATGRRVHPHSSAGRSRRHPRRLGGAGGAAALLPVHARADAPAIRILVRAKKGSRAPLSIAPGLILHDGRASPLWPRRSIAARPRSPGRARISLCAGDRALTIRDLSACTARKTGPPIDHQNRASKPSARAAAPPRSIRRARFRASC